MLQLMENGLKKWKKDIEKDGLHSQKNMKKYRMQRYKVDN